MALVDEVVDEGLRDGDASANLPSVTAPEFVDVVQDPSRHDVVRGPRLDLAAVLPPLR